MKIKRIFNIQKKSLILYLTALLSFTYNMYPQVSNTGEIPNVLPLEKIESLLESEINRDLDKEITAPEDVLRKADELLNLVDFLKKRQKGDMIEKIIIEVEKIYKEGLIKYPNNVRILDQYGSFLYDYKMDYINSVQLWEQALKLDEKNASIHNNLALHYFHIGEYEKGWKHLQNAIQYGDNEPNINYNTAQILIIHRNQIHDMTGWNYEKIYKKAMEHSEKATKLKPDDFELAKDYALNFFTAVQFNLPIDGKKSAVAWQNARKLARNSDEVFYTWVNEGRAWLSIGEIKKARESLVEALKIKPDSAVVQNIISQIDSGEIKESFDEQKKAKRNLPETQIRSPYISPLKNFSGRKKQNPLLPEINKENKKK